MSYPIALNLSGRLCLVVGGGRVARRKVEGLLEAGARVRLVAPAVDQKLSESAAGKRIEWRARRFEAADVEGCWLVVAATDDEAVNRDVAAAAEAAGVWCNVVDRPELCSFIVPAVLRRGDLLVSVSTGGASPLLAGRIRDHLAREFDPAWADYLDLLRRARRAVLARGGPAAENKALFTRILEADLLTPLRQGRLEEAARRLEEACGLSIGRLKGEA